MSRASDVQRRWGTLLDWCVFGVIMLSVSFVIAVILALLGVIG